MEQRIYFVGLRSLDDDSPTHLLSRRRHKKTLIECAQWVIQETSQNKIHYRLALNYAMLTNIWERRHECARRIQSMRAFVCLCSQTHSPHHLCVRRLSSTSLQFLLFKFICSQPSQDPTRFVAPRFWVKRLLAAAASQIRQQKEVMICAVGFRGHI